MEFLNKINEIFSTHLDTTHNIEMDTELQFIENWDSMNAIRIFLALEEAFDCKLSMKKFLGCERVIDIKNLINC